MEMKGEKERVREMESFELTEQSVSSASKTYTPT